ncbi:MAG TPA: hypothetical protein PK358_03590 [Spirochaetota bacterium]|nr:hypothetical protein [Spirochaetota bacterium]HPJ33889.1 hypothetical protein [Spirochaetota bacterium]
MIKISSFLIIISLIFLPLPGTAAENNGSSDGGQEESNGSHFESCGKNSGKGCGKEDKEEDKWKKWKFSGEDGTGDDQK